MSSHRASLIVSALSREMGGHVSRREHALELCGAEKIHDSSLKELIVL